MDSLNLAEFLLKDIRDRRQSYMERMADGGFDSMEQANFIVGQTRGLSYGEDLMKSAMKGIELED